jgi:putative tricarboxylic transport membrane protein
MRTNDAISGAILIILALAMIAFTTTFPPFPGQKYGPSLFPRLLGGGIIVCGALLMMRGFSMRAGGQPWFSRASWMAEPWRLASFLLTFAAMLFYILASEKLGFLIVSTIILSGLFLWFRVRPVVALPLGLAATWIIHWFFVSLMRVPLPRGILTNIL